LDKTYQVVISHQKIDTNQYAAVGEERELRARGIFTVLTQKHEHSNAGKSRSKKAGQPHSLKRKLVVKEKGTVIRRPWDGARENSNFS